MKDQDMKDQDMQTLREENRLLRTVLSLVLIAFGIMMVCIGGYALQILAGG